MSTDYAVKMKFADFIAAASDLGFQLEAVRAASRPGYRLRLVDGSELGCAYDPEQVEANDGSTWTTFTRFGRSDVSGLAGPLGAVDEYSDTFQAIIGCSEERAAYHIGRALRHQFDNDAVTPELVRLMLDQVLGGAKSIRAAARDWAAEYESEPLPTIT